MRASRSSGAKVAVDRALNDPAWWVRNILGHRPWQKQVEIFESVRDNRETAVKSCHAAGKSFSAASVALWFLYAHRPSIVITTAPTDRQVKGILWKEIRTGHQRAKYPLGGTLLSQELKLDNDWWAWGFTAPEYDPDRFQGFHSIHTLVVVDEASGVSEDIFEAIDGVLTSDESRLLMIGNPTNPSGGFAKAFKTPGIGKISIPAFDTPNFTTFDITEHDIIAGTWEEKITGPLPNPYLVTPRWVSDRYKRWGPGSSQYLAKVQAQFPQSGDDTLIPLHWIEAAVERNMPAGSPSEVGVDVARFGSDETVIVHRAGSVVRTLEVIPVCDTMDVAGRTIVAIRNTGARVAKIDGVGVGAGVVDRLNEQGYEIEDMQSGARASDPEQFANTRAEWWWGLRKRFEENDIDIEDDEELLAQLSDMRYKINSRGQVIMESKEDMKKRSRHSPDRADAVMLVFAKGKDHDAETIPASAIHTGRTTPTMSRSSRGVPRFY